MKITKDFKNTVRVEGDTAIIEFTKEGGDYFEILLDVEDLERVTEVCSSVNVYYKIERKIPYVRGYVRMNYRNEFPKLVLLHRFIVFARKGKDVDHWDGNTLNNKRGNLRVVSCTENAQNRKAVNSSGYRNVYKHGIRKNNVDKSEITGRKTGDKVIKIGDLARIALSE